MNAEGRRLLKQWASGKTDAELRARWRFASRLASEAQSEAAWLKRELERRKTNTNSQYEAYRITALPPGTKGPHEDAPYMCWARLQAPSNG